MEVTSSRQHTVNGTRNVFWKNPMTSSGCWRSSRSRIVCMPQHEARHRGLHNSAVERTRSAPLTAALAERGYEGYVAKDEKSVYEPGPTRRWLKVKQPGWALAEDLWQRRISAGA